MWKRPKVEFSDGGHTVVLRRVSSGLPYRDIWRRFRFLAINILILMLVGGIFVYGMWARADIWKFYPSTCLGNWENVQHALGHPELGEESFYGQFNAENSARLTGSGSHIFCANFKSEQEIDFNNKRIKQARLTLSLAYVPPQASSSVEEAVDELRKVLEDPPLPGVTSTEIEAPVAEPEPAFATGTEKNAEEIPSAEEAAPSGAAVPVEEPAAAPVEIVPDPPAPQGGEPSAWLRLVRTAFAQTTTTEETFASSTDAATTTLQIPFDIDPGSLETGESAAPAEQILTDLLELSYSVDGNTWQLISEIVAKDAERVTFSLPLHSWEDIANLQIDLKGLLAGGEVPFVFLDGMELEVIPEDVPDEAPEPEPELLPEAEPSSTPAQKSVEIELDPMATHSCMAEPFATELKRGESGRVALRFLPDEAFASSTPGVRLGDPPAGVETRLAYEAEEYFIDIATFRRSSPGSYSLAVVYWQEEKEPRSYAICQYNLILR
jgi:hypothetical protein